MIKTTAVSTQSKNEAKNIESTFSQSSPTSTIAPACCDNNETLSENVPSDKETRESYLKSQEIVQISNFLVEIGATPTDFLTTDIINDESFLKFFTSLMYSWNVYYTLRKSYNQQGKYNRNSNLKLSLNDIDRSANCLKNQIDTVIYIKCLPNMNTTLLSQTYLKRADALKHVIISGSEFKKPSFRIIMFCMPCDVEYNKGRWLTHCLC